MLSGLERFHCIYTCHIHISYSSEEECSAAYQKFNGRWYAQRQLSCQFCPVQRWRNAICGERHCPVSRCGSHIIEMYGGKVSHISRFGSRLLQLPPRNFVGIDIFYCWISIFSAKIFANESKNFMISCRSVQSEEMPERKTLQFSACVPESRWSLFQSRSRSPSHLSLSSSSLLTTKLTVWSLQLYTYSGTHL